MDAIRDYQRAEEIAALISAVVAEHESAHPEISSQMEQEIEGMRGAIETWTR